MARAQQQEPARFDAFAARTQAEAARIAALIPQVARLTQQQQQAAQEIAIAQLVKQKERLALYSTEAHFAVAQLHDRAASQKDGHRRATVRSSLVLLLVVGLTAGLSACSSVQRWFASDPPEPPTLKTLAGRSATVEKDAGVQATEEQTIAAHRKFLDAAPATKKAPARRGSAPPGRPGDGPRRQRLGHQCGCGQPRLRRRAVPLPRLPQGLPQDPGNDRVLYQMARAQEQTGLLEVALDTLDRLVKQYPKTAYLDEAQFRRGEAALCCASTPRQKSPTAPLLAATAQQLPGPRHLHARGWSRFKQSKLDEALSASSRCSTSRPMPLLKPASCKPSKA